MMIAMNATGATQLRYVKTTRLGRVLPPRKRVLALCCLTRLGMVLMLDYRG
jgi:hypothetical protein